MFWNYKKDNPKIAGRLDAHMDILASISERLAKVENLSGRVAKLEAELLNVMLSQQTMRDKVMKKIRLNEKKDEEEDSHTWNGLPLG